VETPKEKEETVSRTTARAPSNINIRLVVCALLVLQGIWRVGDYLDIHINIVSREYAALAVLGVAVVVVVFGIVRDYLWARVLALLVVCFGLIIDARILYVDLFGNWMNNFDNRGFRLLAFVIDFVVVIYIIGEFRQFSRKC
jgi:hypothetical protein